MQEKYQDELQSHFAFGENWASYARQVSEAEIEEAIKGLKALMGDEDLAGKRFLDIGSGSGLHSLAALRLGAAAELPRLGFAPMRSVLREWPAAQIGLFGTGCDEYVYRRVSGPRAEMASAMAAKG